MASANKKIIELDERLGKQRKGWSDKIRELAHGIKDIDGMEVVISEILHTRQTLLDQMAYINIKVQEQKKVLANRHREAYLRYYEYDYKLGEKQKEKFMESDLADDQIIMSQLENQVEFFRESIKTLDNMGFAVRNRLALKDL